MTIISFPSTPRVEITSRHVTETRHYSAGGMTVVRYECPVLTYYVDFVDCDASSCCVWDGETYDGALEAARTWAAEGIAVRDQTGICWRRA